MNPPQDPAERLEAVVRAFTRLVMETEGQQRTMLRLSLQADFKQPSTLLLRQGRAIAWIEEALLPLRDQLSDQVVRQLTLAIRSVVGIEALVWLTDVARLSREDAVRLMCWSAQGLLQAALTWMPPETSASG